MDLGLKRIKEKEKVCPCRPTIFYLNRIFECIEFKQNLSNWVSGRSYEHAYHFRASKRKCYHFDSIRHHPWSVCVCFFCWVGGWVWVCAAVRAWICTKNALCETSTQILNPSIWVPNFSPCHIELGVRRHQLLHLKRKLSVHWFHLAEYFQQVQSPEAKVLPLPMLSRVAQLLVLCCFLKNCTIKQTSNIILGNTWTMVPMDFSRVLD